MSGFEQVREAARGRWETVLTVLGVAGGNLVDKHGPCPGCGGRDRFRFDDRDGAGTWLCSQGGGGTISGDGFDLLAHVQGWDKARCLREVAGVLGIAMGNGDRPPPSREPGVAPAPKPETGPKRTPFDLAALKLFSQGCEETVNRQWLAERSPCAVEWGTRPGLAADFLSYLYKPGEVILIFTDFRSQGDFAFYNGKTFRLGKAPRIPAVASALPSRGPEGVWFLAAPVTGKWEPMRGGKVGRRHGACVTSWRFAVLESDQAPANLWVRALVQLAIPIAAIYTSGKKSIHALVQIDAASKGEFDLCRDKLVRVLCKLGADGGAISGVRLTRLPGCVRERAGGKQELLYLDPSPQWDRPILSQPTRRNARK